MLYSDRQKAKSIPRGWIEPLRSFEIHLNALGRSPRTISTRLTHLYTVARSINRDTPSEVTSHDIENWCGTNDWAPETRHSYYSSLRVFFRWFYAEAPSKDPSDWLPSIHRPLPPPRPAPDADIEQAISNSDSRTRVILTLAAELGLRAGEIARLHTNDLQPAPDNWSTLTIVGKGNQIRILPVTPSLSWAIRQQAEEPGWVFPGRMDGHLSPRWIGQLATRVLPAPWTLHTLRHRFATTAYNRGTKDLVAIQKALGHQSITTTMRYTQTALELQELMIRTVL